MSQAEFLRQLWESMQPTRLDSLISRVAPGWGLRRLEARAAMAAVGGSAWAGARRGTPEMAHFNPLVNSPDDEQRWDRETLLARSTALERDDALAGGAIAEMATSVVGTGLGLHPEPAMRILGWTQDQTTEWAEIAKERFHLWASSPCECDIQRKRNFYQAQAIAYRTVASRGDAFALMPKRRHPGGIWAAKFQLLEGDRCLNPRSAPDTDRLSQGVETDEVGGVLRYHFCRRHPQGSLTLKPEDWTSVEAWGQDGRRQVLHLYHEHRLDIRRGYPLLAPVIVPLKQMSRLSEAELAAAVVTSFLAVVIKKSGNGPGPLGVKKGAAGQSFTTLGHAMVAELNEGEEIQPFIPNRPNGAFDPFWQSLVGQISMRIQIPHEVLLKKFESSYTAARGALLQFWKFVTTERENLLAPNFCQPLYEMWLAEEVASGRILAPGFFRDPLLRAAYSSARWIGDNPPILDPLKEVMASQQMLDYGLSTHAEETARLNGGDFEANLSRLSREIRMKQEAGVRVDLKPESFGDVTQTAPEPPAQDPNARRQALLGIAMKEDQ
nr:phage portal protein [uncultured Holophaga sp.]